jgi:hypothetical protein
VLDDMVDISYDKIQQHSTRLLNIMDQLHTFVDRTYSSVDFERLNQAAKHNQQLLIEFGQGWPQKLHDTIEKIQQL